MAARANGQGASADWWLPLAALLVVSVGAAGLEAAGLNTALGGAAIIGCCVAANGAAKAGLLGEKQQHDATKRNEKFARTQKFLELRRQFNGGVASGAVDQANYRRFWEAAKDGDAETVRTLLEQGADPDVVSPSGQTPLGIAAMHGHDIDRCEVVAALLRPPLNSIAGVEPDGSESDVSVDKDCGGMTALQIAALRGKSGILRQLLEAGADHTATDRDGETALANAKNEGHKECIAVLEAWAAGTRDAAALDAIAQKARPWFDRLRL